MSAAPEWSPVRESQPLTRRQRRERTARALEAIARSRSRSRTQQLLDYVVEINMGVANSVARRYYHRGIDEDDLLQVAYLALTRAARDFDHGRHGDFLSYAVPTIRGELKKHFRDQGWTVRPPRRVQETQAKVGRAEGDLVQELGRTPTPEEVADRIGAEVTDVVEAGSADGCFAPSSLDRPVNRDDAESASLGDLLGTEDRGHKAAEARVALAPAVRQLEDRDQRILYLRYFEERTQQEIADDIGVTQMQVSRLLSRIQRDLRQELTEEPADQAS